MKKWEGIERVPGGAVCCGLKAPLLNDCEGEPTNSKTARPVVWEL